MTELTVGYETDLPNNKISFEDREKQLQEEDKQKQEDEEKKRRSPFKSFIQVNKKTWKAEDWLMSTSPIAYRIFRFLVNHMDNYNAIICSYQVLEEQFEVSKETIRKAIKLLKDKGYVAVFKSGTSNVYAINDNIVWNSWGTNYRYSKFPTNVILSESEQEKRIKTKIKEIIKK